MMFDDYWWLYSCHIAYNILGICTLDCSQLQLSVYAPMLFFSHSREWMKQTSRRQKRSAQNTSSGNQTIIPYPPETKFWYCLIALFYYISYMQMQTQPFYADLGLFSDQNLRCEGAVQWRYWRLYFSLLQMVPNLMRLDRIWRSNPKKVLKVLTCVGRCQLWCIFTGLKGGAVR